MSLYYTMVAFLDTTYLRFFALSLALHAAMLLIVNPAKPIRVSEPENIPVSVLETPEKNPPASLAPIPRRAPARPPRKPPIVAKKDFPPAPAKPAAAPSKPVPAPPERTSENRPAPADSLPPAAPAPEPAPARREAVPEQSVVAERPLPTVKELLPPLTWSSDSRERGVVSLNTRDPVYVSYFTKIKQQIESQWEYPELALRYGLQGRLFLEFTIDANGQLERLRLLRSSGSQLLDGEALRAIEAAAPFPPIPTWIKSTPLSISAAMEYHDNRVDYQFAR